MPSQLSKGHTYTSGATVDYNDLNQLVDSGTILKGVITEQSSKSVPVGADQILIADSDNSDALKRATITSVFASAPSIGSTTAGTGAFSTLSSTGSSSFANTSGNVSVGFDKNAAQSKLHIAHDSSSGNGLTITDTNPSGATTVTISQITSSSTTATVLSSGAHGYVTGDSVVISGAVQTEYNGLYAVTYVDSTHFTYTFAGSSTSPATGSITSRKTKGANYQIGGNSSSVGKLFFKDLNTATTTLAIDASGNVGIGNTAPSAKLEVTGDIKASTNSTVGTAASSVSISTITYSTTTATVTTSSAHGFTTGDFIRIAGASESVYNGSFAITVTGTPSTSTTFTYTLPSTPSANASGASLLCYKDNFAKVTGNAFASGRVGIGNTTPTVELDVTGSIKASGTITSTGAITSSGTVTAPSITLGSSPIYGVRAWASFNGTSNTGTFAGGASTATRASGVNSVTVTCTNDHGLIVGNYIYALTGVVPQLRMVSNVGSSKTFQFTSGETTALSAVTITFALCPIYASGGVGSITKEASGKYYVNFSTALTDEKYAVQLSPSSNAADTWASRISTPSSTCYGFGYRQSGGGTYVDSDYTTASFIR